jgi:elongation factor 3
MMPGVLNPAAVDFSSGMANLKISPVDFTPAVEAIFTTKTSQAALDGAIALCDNIAANPPGAHHAVSDLLPTITKAANNKKDAGRRESAMIIYGAMYESLLVKAPATEVLLVQETLATVLDGLADKEAFVRESAQYAIDAMFGLLKQPSLVSGFLKALEDYVKKLTGKFQGKVAALDAIAKLADKAIKAYDEQGEIFLRDTMGRALDTLIPVVEYALLDMKNEVRSAYSLLPYTLTFTGLQSRRQDHDRHDKTPPERRCRQTHSFTHQDNEGAEQGNHRESHSRPLANDIHPARHLASPLSPYPYPWPRS